MDIKLKGKLIPVAYGLFQFDGEKWTLKNEETYYTEAIDLDKAAEKAINKDSNREMIMKFFESLEKYGIKFENSQKKMLLTTNNTLALGRSGTGKTTVSAFKVLAIDLLFKAHIKARFSPQKNITLEAKDLSIYSGCGIIFCTASPVLTNEVRRFYKDITQKIKEFLVQKQKLRHKLKKQREKAKKLEAELEEAKIEVVEGKNKVAEEEMMPPTIEEDESEEDYEVSIRNCRAKN